MERDGRRSLYPTALVPIALVSAMACSVALALGPGCSATPTSEVTGQPADLKSNILRSDYAGSAACADCHREIYDRFQRSPMHRMTRSAAAPGTIRAPFDGVTFQQSGDRATIYSREGQRFMRLQSDKADSVDRLYRVTKVIGGRVREDYAGVLVESDEPHARTLDPNEQVLPVSFLLGPKTWRYKGYSVLVSERPGLFAGPTWRQTCLFCHNTTPAITTLYDDLRGGGTYQGSARAHNLPPERQTFWRVSDEAALRESITAELERLDVRTSELPDEPRAFLDEAMRKTYARFGEEDLVELGIGCEACHNGAAAHVADPTVRPELGPRAPFLSRTHQDGTPFSHAEDETRVCARCHTVLFTKYPYTWEGGEHAKNPGGSYINSGEARDFMLGGCASKMTCSQCHDAHGHGEKKISAQDSTCTTGCHTELASDAARGSHSHHDPAQEGASCIACHMPQKNLGLDYELTRYHRIGSPTDKARVEGDRPIECALCHTDWSVDRVLSSIEKMWGKVYDENAIRALYPHRDQTVLGQAIRLGKPHERATAAATLGARGGPSARTDIESLEADPYPLVRNFAAEALRQLATHGK